MFAAGHPGYPPGSAPERATGAQPRRADADRAASRAVGAPRVLPIANSRGGMAIAEPSHMQVIPGALVQGPREPREPREDDLLDGRYILRACIAEGGMGRVYGAEQPAL